MFKHNNVQPKSKIKIMFNDRARRAVEVSCQEGSKHVYWGGVLGGGGGSILPLNNSPPLQNKVLNRTEKIETKKK